MNAELLGGWGSLEIHGLSFPREMKAQRFTMRGVASRSSRCVFRDGGWILLDDVHGDHFGTLFTLIVVDGRIPWFLMADVNGEITLLDKRRWARSRNYAVAVAVGSTAAAAPPPALSPLDLELGPLALQGNLHLEEQRETGVNNCQLIYLTPGAYQSLEEAKL